MYTLEQTCHNIHTHIYIYLYNYICVVLGWIDNRRPIRPDPAAKWRNAKKGFRPSRDNHFRWPPAVGDEAELFAEFAAADSINAPGRSEDPFVKN